MPGSEPVSYTHLDVYKRQGLKLHHGSAGRMLRNKKYLGDDYYPAIIDKEIFDKAEEIRMSRAKALGRVWELKGAVALTRNKR